MEAAAKITRPDSRQVRAERVLTAPRNAVWRAFTSPDLIARWWARGNDMTVVRFDLEPGGHWRYIEHAPDGDFGFEGRFGEIDQPRRMTQTFEWDGAPAHVSLNTFELDEIDDRHTRVTEDTLFMTAEDADSMLAAGMLEGIEESYAALERLLAVEA